VASWGWQATYCRIWTPKFGVRAKPLHEALVRADLEPLTWSTECETVFKTIKDRVTFVPALGLTNLKKPFKLYVHEKQGTELEFLSNSWVKLSKQWPISQNKLGHTANAWPPCLWGVAATCDVLKEAEKFTPGQPIIVHMPQR
jgi:hypothetical protein